MIVAAAAVVLPLSAEAVTVGANFNDNTLIDGELQNFLNSGDFGTVIVTNLGSAEVESALFITNNALGEVGAITLDFNFVNDASDFTFSFNLVDLSTGSDVVVLSEEDVNGDQSFSVDSVPAGAKRIDFFNASGSVVGDNAIATVTAVPLPAGVALMLTGLAGFGFVGRRRQRVAA